MADTIGDIFGRSYRAGRGIGEDWSRMRYARGEAKIRERLAQEAQQAGVSVDQYLVDQNRMADLEAELQQLYQRSGAMKRGISGPGGQRLNETSMGQFEGEFRRGVGRTASQRALAGDYAGMHGALARGAGALGDVEGAMQSSVAQQQTAASRDAYQNGQFNAEQFNQRMGQINANIGAGDQADDRMQQARAMRYRFAQQQMGMFLTAFENKEMYGDDQIQALGTAALQSVPELAGSSKLAFQKDKSSGEFYIARDGAAVGEAVTQNGQLKPEALNMINNLIKDPAGAIQERVDFYKQTAAAQQERQQKIDDKMLDSMLGVIGEYSKGERSQIGSALEKATKAASDAKMSITNTDQGVTAITTADGRMYTMEQNPNAGQPDPRTGVVAPPVTIRDMSGNVVSNLSSVPGLDNVVQSQIEVATLLAKGDEALAFNRLNTAMEMIGRVAQGMGSNVQMGGGAATSEPPADTNEVQSIYKSIAEKHGATITSAVRPVINRGAGARSQHPKGTAADFRTKDKTPEQVEALMADLRAAGFEVIDERNTDQPHIHAELPPGGRATGAIAVAPQQATATGAMPVADTRTPASGITPAMPRPQRDQPAVNTVDLKADREALTAQLADAQAQLREFEASESPGGRGRPTFSRSGALQMAPAYTPGQERTRQALRTQIAQIERGLEAIDTAQKRQQGAVATQAEARRLARYGVAADPTRAAALERWAR